jgi:uncharacterized RDD family membrane protein YckC
LNNENIDISNLELATNQTRLKAFVIDDLLITFVTLMMLWTPLSQVNGDITAVMMIMNGAFIQIILLKFIYQTFFVWYYGATLGKIITKIKIIDYHTFGKVTFMSAMVRSATRILSESILYAGFMLAYYTDSRQTLHDKFARTLVVNG